MSLQDLSWNGGDGKRPWRTDPIDVPCGALGTLYGVVFFIPKALGDPTATFAFLGRVYTFRLSNWKSRWCHRLAEKFFHHYDDVDEGLFGVLTPRDDTFDYEATAEQKRNLVAQAILDCLSGVMVIVREQQRSVLEYAVWFRETFEDDHDDPGAPHSYGIHITRVACHNIVHNSFMGSSEGFKKIAGFGIPEDLTPP